MCPPCPTGTPLGTRGTLRGENPASALCKPSESGGIRSRGFGKVKASGAGPGLPGWGGEGVSPSRGRQRKEEGGGPCRGRIQHPAICCSWARPAALAPSPREDGTGKRGFFRRRNYIAFSSFPKKYGHNRPQRTLRPARLTQRAPGFCGDTFPPIFLGGEPGRTGTEPSLRGSPGDTWGVGPVPPLPRLPTHGPACDAGHPGVCVRETRFCFAFLFKIFFFSFFKIYFSRR